MKVNLKMDNGPATSVTFTDEEEISKPRLGINYDGHKLYTPMGLGWYDNNKKGLYSNLYSRSLAALWGKEHRGEEQYGILIQVNPNTVGIKVTISDGTSYTFNTSEEIQTLYIAPPEDESEKTITIKDLYNYKSVNYTVPKESFKTLIMYNSETKVNISTLIVFAVIAYYTNEQIIAGTYSGAQVEANYKGTAKFHWQNGANTTVNFDNTVTRLTEIWNYKRYEGNIGGNCSAFDCTVTCGGKEYRATSTGQNRIAITDYTFEIEEGE